MAIPVVQFEELRERVKTLEREVQALRLFIWPQERKTQSEPLSDEGQMLARLQRQGLIIEPTPEMIRQAQEWDQLPEEEKRSLRETLDSLHLDPPLSQIISDNRR